LCNCNAVAQTGDQLLNQGLVGKLLDTCPNFVALKWTSSTLLQVR
jgi:hypothetical protein